MSNGFVVLMGMGTVFFGLIVLILLCMLMSKICMCFEKKESSAKSAPSATTCADAAPTQNEGNISVELKAAVAAAIAEEMGTDVSAIRILSFKAV